MLRMANENETANVNADGNVEAMRNAAKTRRHAHAHGDRGRLADGHGRLGRGSPRASSFYRRLRRVGLMSIGGFYCPRPFSV